LSRPSSAQAGVGDGEGVGTGVGSGRGVGVGPGAASSGTGVGLGLAGIEARLGDLEAIAGNRLPNTNRGSRTSGTPAPRPLRASRSWRRSGDDDRRRAPMARPCGASSATAARSASTIAKMRYPVNRRLAIRRRPAPGQSARSSSPSGWSVPQRRDHTTATTGSSNRMPGERRRGPPVRARAARTRESRRWRERGGGSRGA
jgi:hypothetical protein